MFGPSTTTNPSGFCQVTQRNGKFHSTGRDCNSLLAKSPPPKKYVSVFMSCTVYSGNQNRLLHLLKNLHCWPQTISNFFLISPQQPGTTATTTRTSTTPITQSRSSTATQLMSNKTIPYHIHPAVINSIMKMEASTFNGSTGWPNIITYEDSVCELCGNELSDPTQHPGKASSEAHLLTEP